MPVSLDFATIAPLIEENRRRRRLAPPMGSPGGYAAPGYSPEESAPPSYSQRYQSEKEGYMRGTPGRGKSALLGGLRNFAGGGGLAGAAMGALGGAMDPRGLREQQFNERVRPGLEERFSLENADRVQQMAELNQRRQSAMDTLKMADLSAGTDLKVSEAERNRRPPIQKAAAAAWKLGRNLKTGQFKWFDAADPTQAAEHTPHVNQPGEPTQFVVNDRGEYIDVKAEERAGRKVKAFQRPRAGGAGTQANKKKEPPKYIGLTDVRAWAKENGKTESQAVARFQSEGWRISR